MVTLFDIVVFEGTYLVKLLTDCYEDGSSEKLSATLLFRFDFFMTVSDSNKISCPQN
jgi:hypothetical protein